MMTSYFAYYLPYLKQQYVSFMVTKHENYFQIFC